MTHSQNIPDVQGLRDTRAVPIYWVGVKDIPHRFSLQLDGMQAQQTHGKVAMYVSLPGDRKGTHMSRFMEMLNDGDTVFSPQELHTMLPLMRDRLNTTDGLIEVSGKIFLRKAAPVSGIESWLDYDVQLRGEIHGDQTSVLCTVVVPVTTLCPCSRDISEYGAHNQRSHVSVTWNSDHGLEATRIIALIEQSASCELFGILKRSDEKHVTERAYDNPKFVEDLIRDASIALTDNGLAAHRLTVENFESIHNHSAYAIIDTLA